MAVHPLIRRPEEKSKAKQAGKSGQALKSGPAGSRQTPQKGYLLDGVLDPPTQGW